jgi:ABC-type multidrug transport system fused ATPase/permease subunit
MNGIAAGDKIFRLLDLSEKPPAAAAGAVRTNTARNGEARADAIRLEKLCFAWEPERPTLRDITLEIPERGFIALVGESGSGKSTVAAILSGRAAPYTGSASLGGVEIAALPPEALMRSITLVDHASYLFAGTLRENLLMARPEATDGELRAALQLVRLEEFIDSREGLETRIAEGAANLSGGQKQRAAIARALLHDTGIYIFDEASSNIDRESEEAIMEAINGLAKRKTVLVITHRLANARRADRIAVLDQGRLAAFDTHEALMEMGGIYERMFRQQEALEALVHGGVAG